MRILCIFFIPIIGIILSSCSRDAAVADSTGLQLTQDTTTIDAYLKQKNIVATKLFPGIWFITDSATEGIRPAFNDSVKLKYTTRLLADNSILDHSAGARHFVLDSLISGIQYALPEFQAGSKGRIFIPSFYAYGSSNLIFEFQLADVKDYQLKLDTIAIDNYLSAHSINAVKDVSGLRYTVDSLKTGSKVFLTDEIQINYTTKNLSDGSIVDKGTSASFIVSNLILGLQIGIQKQPEGSTFTFYVPSSLAYGPVGAFSVSANTNLIINVKLLKVIHH